MNIQKALSHIILTTSVKELLIVLFIRGVWSSVSSQVIWVVNREQLPGHQETWEHHYKRTEVWSGIRW